ncbi:MAG: glycosyltransferase family 4 protein [Bacteroidota bacterium]
MRIVVFNWQDRLHPQAGGAETHLHEIFSRMVRKGHDVTLVSCRFPGASDAEIIDGMKVIRIGSRSTYNVAAALWWLGTGAKQSFDLVVDDINKIPLMLPLLCRAPVMGLIHHLFGTSIYQEAGPIAGSYVRIAELCIPSVYRHTPLVVVSESTRAECIAAGLPAGNIRVIHNGIDPSVFPMAVSGKAEHPTIVYFGRLKRYKSVDHVIDALRIVRRSIPQARLEIVGRGDDELRLRSLVRSHGLEDCVVFHGFVDEQTKIRLLSAAHVAVNPSRKEGWGITNIESNACGTPVVSADSPGLRDSISNGVSGLLYPYGNIADLAQQMVRVLSDSELRSALSRGAVEWARSFSWDESARVMEQTFTEVVFGSFGS